MTYTSPSWAPAPAAPATIDLDDPHSIAVAFAATWPGLHYRGKGFRTMVRDPFRPGNFAETCPVAVDTHTIEKRLYDWILHGDAIVKGKVQRCVAPNQKQIRAILFSLKNVLPASIDAAKAAHSAGG